MLFCAFVCSVWAGPTDLPEMTEDTNNPVWYAIKNVRSGKNVTYAGDAATMTQQASATAASFFYLTSSTEGAVKIHNYAAGDKLCAAYNSWTETGIDWYLAVQATGVSICTSTGEWNAWNDAGGNGQKVEYWSASDAGSAWEFVKITDFSTVIDVPAAKAAAIAELENLASVSTIYPAAAIAIAAVNEVPADDKSLAGLNAAVEAVNKVVADYKAAAYQALSGKYFTINTLGRVQEKCGYMKASGSSVVGTETAVSPANIWQFEYNDGAVSVFNPYTGLYLGTPGGNSSNISLTADKAKYDLVVFANASNADAKIKLTCDGKSVHMAGHGTLVRWDNGGASEWAVIEVADFSAIVDAYKTSTLSTLDEWSELSVVFDASLINAAKTAINGIATTNWEALVAIGAELKKVTDAVAAKMFTFQTTATDNHRNGVWVSANANTGKAIGAVAQDYNAIWSLRHAGGVSFYMFNELNHVYMGAPNANCPLTAEPTTAYTFEIVDVENNVVEMHVGGQTLHASNHDDDKLLNWDGDEAASRWYINTIDVTADIQNLLNSLTPADYADVPEIGQYPTEAYNALVAAKETVSTVEEVEAAIAAFKKSKNRPVFTISGTKDYVVGKSIFDDNSGTLRFKTTDNCDKSMWWVFDQTSATVGVTDEVVVTNYATGNNFWGANSVKITETSEAIADDGIFLLYTTGNGTPVHYQQSTSTMVRWNSTEATSGSAMTFTLVGGTYVLDKLTDAHLEALSAVKTAYEAYKSYEEAELVYDETPALGEYGVNPAEFMAALATVKSYCSLTFAQLAQANVDELNAAVADLTAKATAFIASLNRPVYFITSKMEGYAAGSAIYFDGTSWKWGAADKFNRQMWMTIPEYTNEDVPTVDAYDAEGVHYAICDYLTNTVMRDKNVQIVNVEGWEGAMNLQYSANNAQHADQSGVLVEWRPAKVVEGAVDCGASAWHVEYIGTSYELDKLTDAHFIGVNTLALLVDDEVEFGTEVGYYSEEAYTAAKAAAEAIVAKSLVELSAISAADVQAAVANLNNAIVTPDPNKYYMLESASTNEYCAGQRVYVAKDGYMGFNNENLMANVFQFVPAADGKFYLSHVETGSALSTAKAGGEGAQAAHTALYDVDPVAVSISNMGSKNIVKLVPDGGDMIHAQKDGSAVVGWNNHSYEGASAWYIKEVDINNYAHELTVTDAEWATLVLGFNTVIPEDVTAYIVSAVNAESATLTQVEGVLPANTPVLLNAPAAIYSFTVSTETPEEISNNILDGCTIDRHVYEDIYVLGNGTDGVGFYKAKYNVNADTSNDIVEGEGEDAVTTPTYEAILSNAFKAFLPANGDAAQALRFNFGGTTAIESVVNGINANAAIYDLSGRRVEKATKGIYIVNGKKMIVK